MRSEQKGGSAARAGGTGSFHVTSFSRGNKSILLHLSAHDAFSLGLLYNTQQEKKSSLVDEHLVAPCAQLLEASLTSKDQFYSFKTMSLGLPVTSVVF